MTTIELFKNGQNGDDDFFIFSNPSDLIWRYWVEIYMQTSLGKVYIYTILPLNVGTYSKHTQKLFAVQIHHFSISYKLWQKNMDFIISEKNMITQKDVNNNVFN